MEYLRPCPFCGCKWKKVGITRFSFLLYHDPNCFFWCIGYPVMEHSAGDGNMPKRIIKWNQRAELTCKLEYVEGWTGGSSHAVKCTSCGEMSDSAEYGMNYCPQCGVKAVE